MRSYDRSWLRRDLIAGVAVAALIIPKNLGYAGIAGIPLQNGLYAAAAGAILYPIFGTCRQISTGPSSGLAAVAASAVLAAGITGTHNAAAFVAAITLVSGGLFLLIAIFKMGWIAQFLSRAVVTGFLFGAAIDVVIGELPKLTGTEVSGSNPLHELKSWLGSLGDTNRATVIVGVVSLAVIFGLQVVAPEFREPLSSSSAGCSLPTSSISVPTAWPLSARYREGCQASMFLTLSSSGPMRARSAWPRWL